MDKALPLISVVTPVYNTEPEVLRRAIDSVQSQSYYNWELCICDDCSNDAKTIELLASYKGLDSRIKIIRSPENLHISRASNLAAEMATGEFLVFLDHDDELSEDALFEIAKACRSTDDTDLVYSDEDKIDSDGSHCDICFKPDWSPEHLLSVMYTLHPLTIRKSLFFELEGFREEYSGAQDYDLVLRASRVARSIVHIPKILYHWRKVEGSASAEVDAKPYALEAGKRALQNYVEQGKRAGTVVDGRLPGLFRVRYDLAADTEVTILILTNDGSREIPERGEINLVRNSLASIAKDSTFKNYKFLVIHNNELSNETLKLLDSLGGEEISFDKDVPFNYPQRLNFGLSHVKTNNVIILNDDVEVITPDWIESLLEWSQIPEIGAVGARLLYPNRLVQHSGLALDPDLGATHVFYRLKESDIGYYGYTHLIRNYAAVTAAVMATRMDVIEAVGGFDEALAIDFNDVDFCLKLHRDNYRVVFTPFCELVHLEGSSIKRTAQNPKEVALFKARWHELIKRDPFLNYQAIRQAYPYAMDGSGD